MGYELSKVAKDIVASLILNGDISRLDQSQRVEYVTGLCNRLGVDPMTQPFKILRLQGKEVLYADKGCSQQLCQVHNISTEVTKKEKIDDVYVVTVRAKLGDRYTDEDGAVNISGCKGDVLANALMKAVTKAKRRAVLALCGLGMLDEAELETIPGAVPAGAIDVQGVIKPNTITNAQLSQLRDMLIDLGDENKEDAFAKYLGVPDLELLPESKFNTAMAALVAKKEKRQKGGAK